MTKELKDWKAKGEKQGDTSERKGRGGGEAPLRFEPCTYSVKATCYTTQPAHHLYDFWAEVV